MSAPSSIRGCSATWKVPVLDASDVVRKAKNRVTKAVIVLERKGKFAPEFRFLCETHGDSVDLGTKAPRETQVRVLLHHPERWCDGCEVAFGERVAS